ncbi:uncharacterized protein LOC110244893 [Exaiptasia diaphana]|uniref:Uncharacterized protein n=1 Tax=Exaiptasia diaphana TaxID=2652724 RepID=A0A913XMP9_EXADI|nr:uncharacterized protein LOC110244893 [Exaiptasia diaphana]
MAQNKALGLKVSIALLASIMISLGSSSIIVIPAPTNHIKSVDAWCTSFTGHLSRTIQQFGSVRFNKTSQTTTAAPAKESMRLAFDHRDLKIYSILLDDVMNVAGNVTLVGARIQSCISRNKVGMSALLGAMELSKLYLNGTIPTHPVVISSSAPIQTYKNIATHMAALKKQFKDLALLYSNFFTASVIVKPVH